MAQIIHLYGFTCMKIYEFKLDFIEDKGFDSTTKKYQWTAAYIQMLLISRIKCDTKPSGVVWDCISNTIQWKDEYVRVNIGNFYS